MTAHPDLLNLLFAEPIAEPRPAAKRVTLHFYRCADCLGVVTMESKLTTWYDARGASRLGVCGACGGFLEYMGRTERDRLVKDELRCPCDDRCTSARGPHCDCRCGGENHGSNLVVQVTVDAGGIPTTSAPADTPRYQLLAKQYRDLAAGVGAAIDARFGAIIARKCRGEYLDYSEYSRYCTGTAYRRRLYAAKEMRVHAARNKALRALLAEVSK